jgi:hypothetical protein
LRGRDWFSGRLRPSAHPRTWANGSVDGTISCGPGSRNPTVVFGNSLPRVARVVLLDAFYRPVPIRNLETLLPTKLDSSATAELSALGTWMSAGRRRRLGVGTTAISRPASCTQALWLRLAALGRKVAENSVLSSFRPSASFIDNASSAERGGRLGLVWRKRTHSD